MTVLEKIIQMFKMCGAKETAELLVHYLKDEESQIRSAWVAGNLNEEINLGENKPDLDSYINKIKNQ